MTINEFVGNLAVRELNRGDNTLYDCILEMDRTTLMYILSSKYKIEIFNAKCTKESFKFTKITDTIESALNNRNINIRSCG